LSRITLTYDTGLEDMIAKRNTHWQLEVYTIKPNIKHSRLGV